MKRFKEFLTEIKITPTAIEHGSDYKNGEFRTIGSLYVTYFMYEGIKAKFLYYSDNGELAYGVFSEEEKQWRLKPSSTSIHFKNMFKFFGILLYLMEELIKQYDVKIIKFSASEERLEKFYELLNRDKGIIELFYSLGFTKRTKKTGEGLFYIYEKE
jgi:hypothetical protein